MKCSYLYPSFWVASIQQMRQLTQAINNHHIWNEYIYFINVKERNIGSYLDMRYRTGYWLCRSPNIMHTELGYFCKIQSFSLETSFKAILYSHSLSILCLHSWLKIICHNLHHTSDSIFYRLFTLSFRYHWNPSSYLAVNIGQIWFILWKTPFAFKEKKFLTFL